MDFQDTLPQNVIATAQMSVKSETLPRRMPTPKHIFLPRETVMEVRRKAFLPAYLILGLRMRAVKKESLQRNDSLSKLSIPATLVNQNHPQNQNACKK